MASKRRVREQGCGKKRRFNTQPEAVAHIGYLRAINVITGPTNCYRCKFCGYFHWGHGKFYGSNRI